MDKDEFYRDILEGMALYTRSAFQRDVLKTLSRLDEPALAEALNKNQIASKLWLADALFDAAGADLGNVLVLGGWLGVLACDPAARRPLRDREGHEPRYRPALRARRACAQR